MLDLRKRREELGLSLEKVSEAVGVSKSTISRYELGKIKGIGCNIKKYAKVLGIDLIDMLELFELPDFLNYVKLTCHHCKTTTVVCTDEAGEAIGSCPVCGKRLYGSYGCIYYEGNES